MPGSQILIVEDDASLRESLSIGLRDEGFEPIAVGTGGQALAALERLEPAALIIDIGLPDVDGRDLCQAVRARGVTAPTMFLTARTAVVDRISGFNAGGDDYVLKPFSVDELVVRLRALLRRADAPPGAAAGPAAPGALVLDPATHGCSVGTTSVTLTPTEYRVLGALLATPGTVLRRRELAQAGWPSGAIVHDNTLDAYIARLRRKLATLDGAPGIRTAHGVGYAIE